VIISCCRRLSGSSGDIRTPKVGRRDAMRQNEAVRRDDSEVPSGQLDRRVVLFGIAAFWPSTA
jgi:hypothetical protein